MRLLDNTLFLIKEANRVLSKKEKAIVSSVLAGLFTILLLISNSPAYAKEESVVEESNAVEEEPYYTEEAILEEIKESGELEDGGVNEGWNFGRGEEPVEQEESAELEELEESEETNYEEVYNTLTDNHELGFVKGLLEDAVSLADEYNIYPSVMVAQSILESDWGRSPLATGANNLFGVKGSYEGQSVEHLTKEDDGQGNMYEIVDKFAKYPSYKESMESNARLLRNGTGFDAEFYKGTWKENATDYKQVTQALTGTYATDTSYQNKLNTIIERHNLDVLDK